MKKIYPQDLKGSRLLKESVPQVTVSICFCIPYIDTVYNNKLVCSLLVIMVGFYSNFRKYIILSCIYIYDIKIFMSTMPVFPFWDKNNDFFAISNFSHLVIVLILIRKFDWLTRQQINCNYFLMSDWLL